MIVFALPLVTVVPVLWKLVPESVGFPRHAGVSCDADLHVTTDGPLRSC